MNLGLFIAPKWCNGGLRLILGFARWRAGMMSILNEGKGLRLNLSGGLGWFCAKGHG